jgi:hypothetical protein|tara:strand:+ start:632 stop:1111 length:480 start_codon:yes stop_codon:yes gene_type:complete
MKIIEKLSTYAALIGVIGAIGGGFYTWGQFNTRLDAIESTPAVDLSPLKNKDKELNSKIDEALLYANEYKVDLIDRIKKVDDKIVPVDLTTVFKDIAKVREQMAMIDIPNIDGLKKDIKEIKAALSEMERQLAVVAKENELQDILIEEMKTRANNPLAN